jgi:hypothetical protein
LLAEQDGSGMPGSEVTCQQEIKPLRKTHSPTARMAPAATMIHWKMDGRAKVPGFCTGSDLFRAILSITHFCLGGLAGRLRAARLPNNVPAKIMATIIMPQTMIPSVMWA